VITPAATNLFLLQLHEVPKKKEKIWDGITILKSNARQALVATIARWAGFMLDPTLSLSMI